MESANTHRMSARKLRVPRGVMRVPERELMGDILLRESSEPALPVHVSIRKLARVEDGHYLDTEDRDKAVKRRQLANAKERLRVRSLNGMFSCLRRIVPVMPLDRKPSKVDMLKAATEYIRLLSAVLSHASAGHAPPSPVHSLPDFDGVNSDFFLDPGINYSSLESDCSDLWSMEDQESVCNPGVAEEVCVGAASVQCVLPVFIVEVEADQLI